MIFKPQSDLAILTSATTSSSRRRSTKEFVAKNVGFAGRH